MSAHSRRLFYGEVKVREIRVVLYAQNALAYIQRQMYIAALSGLLQLDSIPPRGGIDEKRATPPWLLADRPHYAILWVVRSPADRWVGQYRAGGLTPARYVLDAQLRCFGQLLTVMNYTTFPGFVNGLGPVFFPLCDCSWR